MTIVTPVDDPTWPCGGADCTCVDLERLPPTVPPSVPATLDGGREVVTPALRPGLL